MKKTLILLLTFNFCTRLVAQDVKQAQADSIRKEQRMQAALLYPRIRQFSITHEEQAVGNIHAKLYGNDFFEGKFRMSRTSINMNMPIFQHEKSSLITSLGVVHQFFYLSDATSYQPDHQVENINTYIPMISQSLTYIQRAKIGNKMVNFTASLGGIFTPSYSKTQFNFTGVVAVPFIQNEHSTLIAGAVVMVDPSALAPAFVFVNYHHKFDRAGMDLMVDIPQRISLRKSVTSKFSVALNSDLVGSNSFFEFGNPNPTLPAKMTFSSLELKSGILAEYRVTNKVILSVGGGINSTLKSRILENNAKPNDYFIDNKRQAVPYVQVGLSLLPFWKGLNL